MFPPITCATARRLIDEDAPCRPQSNYGKTKYYAEEMVAESFSRGHVILRSALVYGWGKGASHGFLDWLWGSLSRGEKVRAFTDEYRTPVFLKDFIAAVRAAVSYPRGGRFHVAGSERLSRYEFAQRFCKVMGVDPALVEAVSLDSDSALAYRPREGGLSNERMRTVLSVVPTGMERALGIIRDEILR
ncbi:sugar nucleotide-binding protein [bacterium]|nr:sugar nucleotide-binding protein [bacterium]